MIVAGLRRLLSFVMLAGPGGVLSSCGMTAIPPPDQGGQVDPAARLVVKEASGIQVAVPSEAWHDVPSSFDKYLAPAPGLIRNHAAWRHITDSSTVRLQEFHLTIDR